MQISDYINNKKKTAWRRRVFTEKGPGYVKVSQEQFLDEVTPAAHAINSPRMSRRPIYGPSQSKDGKKRWTIVGYDNVETVPSGMQDAIVGRKISHFSADGFWVASEDDKPELFNKLMSWYDTAGIKTAFIEVIKSAFRTGDGAIYLYQTGDKDDPIQYEVFGFEEGSVLYPQTTFDGEKSVARKYTFNGHAAVDIFTSKTIETWMQIKKEDKDYADIVGKNEQPEVSEDGYVLVRKKEAQAGNGLCQCIYFRVNDIPTGDVQPLIEKLEDGKTYVGEHLKGSTMPVLFVKAEKMDSLPPSRIANRTIGVKGPADSLAHADAKFIAPPDASNIANLHLDGLEDDIRQTSMSVKIDPEIIKQGSDSSATMKILYAPEVQWAQTHWPEVYKSVKQLMAVFKALVGKVEGKPKEYGELRISVGQNIWIPQNEAEALKMELDQVYARVKSRKAAIQDIGNSHIGDYEQIGEEWLEEITNKAEAGPKAKKKFGDSGDTFGADDEDKNPADVTNQATGKSIQE